ncbi:MAG: glutamine synthetase family protein [Acidimicrobiia bacterium]|jgi:glutamine synthetase
MSKQADYVMRTVEERGIRFIRLWFTDVLGFLKSVAISPAELEVAFEEGMTFDGSSIDGYARIQEADMLARPDPTTFAVLPWRTEQQVARMFCDIAMPDGEPFDGDPRTVLKRNLEKASEMGYTFYTAPELEFFYFADSGPEPQVLDHGGYFDLTPLDVAQEYRRKTINALEQLGIPIEHSHHEVAPSQHEIIARYTDALTMADNIMTSRLTVKEVALQSGIYATFMPKPLEKHDGSGMHLHLSLFEGDTNAFHEPGTQGELSKVGKAFIAGVLHHAAEMTAVTNQWVNSYKRLVGGFDAPVYMSWARNNQSALVRVPSVKKGKPSSVRIEYRAADAACNPYLALSVILAAGLAGIREGYELPPEISADVHQMTNAERAAVGAKRLPDTMAAALDLMEESDLVAEALGEHVFNWFLRNKRAEWNRYQSHVSRFELETYLPIL